MTIIKGYSKFQKGQTAVALGYDQNADIAPKVLASGQGVVAEKIKEIARENNIPIYEDKGLIEILALLDIDEYIPLEAYAAVAEILSYIYKQNNLVKQNDNLNE